MVNSLIYSQLLSPHRLIRENILEHQLLKLFHQFLEHQVR